MFPNMLVWFPYKIIIKTVYFYSILSGKEMLNKETNENVETR